MASSSLQPAQPLAADGGALSRVLQQAGVSRDSVLRVTGAAGLTAIFWLCRHGYERAAYVHPDRVATMVPADALLIPQACGTRALAVLLQGGGCLREGGALIVQTLSEAQGGDDLRAVLEPLGYQIERRLSDKGRGVCVARRRGRPDLRKAA
jgi:hypothetical protein